MTNDPADAGTNDPTASLREARRAGEWRGLRTLGGGGRRRAPPAALRPAMRAGCAAILAILAAGRGILPRGPSGASAAPGVRPRRTGTRLRFRGRMPRRAARMAAPFAALDQCKPAIAMFGRGGIWRILGVGTLLAPAPGRTPFSRVSGGSRSRTRVTAGYRLMSLRDGEAEPRGRRAKRGGGNVLWTPRSRFAASLGEWVAGFTDLGCGRAWEGSRRGNGASCSRCGRLC
jgi:hypothetical protein